MRVCFFAVYSIFLTPRGILDSRGSKRIGTFPRSAEYLLMHRRLAKSVTLLALGIYLMTGVPAQARSLMDFFRAIGNSIAHPQKKQSKSRGKSSKGSETATAS